jgi:hypothetical protein
VAKGRDLFPDEIHIQTKTPFYGRVKWLNLHGLEESWQEARLDAKVLDGQTVEFKTQNVTATFYAPQLLAPSSFSEIAASRDMRANGVDAEKENVRDFHDLFR